MDKAVYLSVTLFYVFTYFDWPLFLQGRAVKWKFHALIELSGYYFDKKWSNAILP